MKIRPVAAQLCHADRQTDRQTDVTKLIIIFPNFTSSSKNKKTCGLKISLLKITR
jgi:hypothetical protein